MERYDPPDHPIWHEMARREELEAENAQLRALIREMGEGIEYVLSPEFYAKNGVRRRKPLEELLSRPEVQEIMKETKP